MILSPFFPLYNHFHPLFSLAGKNLRLYLGIKVAPLCCLFWLSTQTIILIRGPQSIVRKVWDNVLSAGHYRKTNSGRMERSRPQWWGIFHHSLHDTLL